MIRYGFKHAISGFFEFPTENARALVPRPLEPVELHHGSSVLSVTVFDFTESCVGAYREAVFSVAVMPLVKGDDDDNPDHPRGRIRNTRKLLATAAIIMSVFLIGSSLVVSTLINPNNLRDRTILVDGEETIIHGPAKDRALAFIAHGESSKPIDGWFQNLFGFRLFNHVFGTIYDLGTVVILWFAGASAMSGLLNLVPRYLPRFGMAPEWARAIRPIYHERCTREGEPELQCARGVVERALPFTGQGQPVEGHRVKGNMRPAVDDRLRPRA